MTKATIGDIVMHIDEAHPNRWARVIGFGPIDRWLRVVTPNDGKIRIWARENVFVLDTDMIEEFGFDKDWPAKS